ncbi:hypothetical protein FACS1894184_14340 [Clostridia bacterium]|nr:hypothetical protein FACS1894184_14340 [Clostridia bacterium]
MPKVARGMPVRIAVNSAQTVDGETNSTRLLTLGKLYRQAEGFSLVYTESSLDPSFHPFTFITKVTCGNERVSMERPDFSAMVFDKVSQFASHDGGEAYEGDAYRLLADTVDYTLGDEDGRINLSFSIMGDCDAGKYNIDIKFAKQQPPPRIRGLKPPLFQSVVIRVGDGIGG